MFSSTAFLLIVVEINLLFSQQSHAFHNIAKYNNFHSKLYFKNKKYPDENRSQPFQYHCKNRHLKTTLFETSAAASHVTVKEEGRDNNNYKNKNKKRSKSKQRNGKRNRNNIGNNKNSNKVETWRLFGIEVDPDSLAASSKHFESVKQKKDKEGDNKIPIEKTYLTFPVLNALYTRLKIKINSSESNNEDMNKNLPVFPLTNLSLLRNNNNKKESVISIIDARVIRRSLDARKNRGRRSNNGSSSTATPSSSAPRYTYVIDIDLTREMAQQLRLKNQPGRCELSLESSSKEPPLSISSEILNSQSQSTPKQPVIVVVGAGPAGLFCALKLCLLGGKRKNSSISTNPKVILLERGQPVEKRGKSIGALIHRKQMDKESNFAFGEGGAGTWSDGKLTTRIGRNSDNVRFVLETFVKYGAPEKILVDGAPHLGTDNLVRLLRNMRLDLINNYGADIQFGAKVTRILKKNGAVKGVEVEYNKMSNDYSDREEFLERQTIQADAVVLATGHSARDTYEELAHSGVLLEPKGFAAGFRVEHPQSLINKLQYGKEWSPSVITGKKLTDEANLNFLSSSSQQKEDLRTYNKHHPGHLPVASYRLATDKAYDGSQNRGAYSFCMCPGGQIVPASTDPNMVCVNGMSFSKRDSLFANSAMVVTVQPDDPILDPYKQDGHGVLAGIAFQKDMEIRAAELGGGDLVCPVQSLTDFIERKPTTTKNISSSYRLGVREGTPVHDIYPKQMMDALSDALITQFDQKTMPGYLCKEGILHAVETRTSSPVRILRSDETFQAIGLKRLFPAGEGAGFAGGIVSAGVDGLNTANAVLQEFYGLGDESGSIRKKREKSVGFDY